MVFRKNQEICVGRSYAQIEGNKMKGRRTKGIKKGEKHGGTTVIIEG